MSDRDQNPPDLEAIRAELAALGEDLDDLSGEFEQADLLGSALDNARGGLLGADPIPQGLSLLQLSAAEGSMSDTRSQALLQGLHTALSETETPSSVARELIAVGERVDGALDHEIGDAALLGDVLDAFRSGPALIDALPDPPPVQMERLEGSLAGMHRLRATSAESELNSARAEILWSKTQANLPQSPQAQVVDIRRWRQRAIIGATFAAAAAVIVVCGSGIIFQNQFNKTDVTTTAPVAQIELVQAEEKLAQVESDTLKVLMSGNDAPEGPKGDHYLRELRQARHEAIRARTQARERRL